MHIHIYTYFCMRPLGDGFCAPGTKAGTPSGTRAVAPSTE